MGLVGGSVRSTDSDTGALAGWNDGIISNSYASTTVTGGVDAGGLVGGPAATQNRPQLRDRCRERLGVYRRAGGLQPGRHQQQLFHRHRHQLSHSAGGLVGYMLNDGNITSSYSTSAVTGTNDTIGGLVGYWSGSS